MRKLLSASSALALLAGLAAWQPAYAQDKAQDPETVVDELIVTGQRAAQEKAIQAKRDATGVIDAISADDIGRLADKNVAENLERVPGVGLFYDQGEGRYVSIRGMDSSLNNVTLNGVELGNPDGLSSEPRVPLDVVGGQLLSRIEVVKVVTSDMDAQGIGGSVNLVTRSPFESKKDRFGNINLSVGYQEFNEDSHPWQGDATAGAIFGGGKWGALLGVSGSSREFHSNGFFPDDWRAVPGTGRGGLPTTVKYTNYTIQRDRVGVSGALEFRPTDDDKYYLRGLYSKFTEDEHRQRFRGDFGSNLANITFNADGFTGIAKNVDVREDLREEYKEKSFSQLSVGGENARGPWTVDYDLSYGKDDVVEPNKLWQFRSVTANTTFDFNMKPLLFTSEPRDLPLSNLGFRQYQEQDEHGEETDWTGKFDVKRDINVADGGYLKFGAKVRDQDKTFDGHTDVWDRAGAGANRFTLADFDLHGPDELVAFEDQTYVIRYVIGENIKPFTVDNLTGPKFVKNVATSLTNETVNDFELHQRVSAGYGMGQVKFGGLTVIGGVRVENTDITDDGFRLVATNNTVVPFSREQSYTDVLPNVQLKFDANDQLVFRGAYSRTLGHPNFGQLKVSGTLTFTQLNNGLFEGDLSEGNVDLKPFVSDNFDGTAEWYFAKGGLISAGAFYKDISNPIFNFTQTFTNVDLDGRTFQTLRYNQPRNAKGGKISGLELAYQQQFVMLPGLLSGLGIAVNATFTDAYVDTFDRRADFAQQSDLLWGAQIFYQKDKVEGALSFHHTGKNLLSLGSTAAGDTYNDDYERLDFKGSYDVTQNVQVFFEAQNLTDTKLRQYIGGRSDWVTNYERLRRTFYVGLSAKW